ncbi:helix-turn-helix domain-containing protein [Cohnella nanjingensis]|uniref:Helix-turn-helix domain-containing protein n=1 Tax=Cohnella nanjingensis TaxID=1387779 RepID=A0A7X0RL21_9BACL|nr:helix-turn-helix domain-containing protein [Cohnella nanjingensis]MBB6669321.1 helix-turn-helix domain-containing protein [Cohnella nanjingensis]
MFTATEDIDLSYLGKLLHETLQLSVFCLTDYQEILFLNGNSATHPLFSNPADLFRAVAKHGADLTGPVLYESNDLEQFAVVPVKRQEGLARGVVIIGPSTHRMPNDKLFDELLIDHRIPCPQRPNWRDYWNCIPYADRIRILHICVSANWMLNGEALDITDVLQSSIRYKLPNQHKDKEIELAERREFSIFHEGIAEYHHMRELIRRGEPEQLMKQLMIATKDDSQVRDLSKQHRLRKVKNMSICAVALSSNDAMQGGLYEEIAMALCDLHIQHIEELSELALVESAVISAIVDFADRVRQFRNSSVSKSVRAGMEYIFLHLFEEITLEQLSEVSGLNPHYLSQCFKKETGMSVMNYIQSERIEEAKRQLDQSKDSISQIGDRLTFYDQSHFVKAFKKHTGLTPRQYRNRNRA